jgi:hypothetical protein
MTIFRTVRSMPTCFLTTRPVSRDPPIPSTAGAGLWVDPFAKTEHSFSWVMRESAISFLTLVS